MRLKVGKFKSFFMNNRKRTPIYTVYIILCIFLSYKYNVLNFMELIGYLNYILRYDRFSFNVILNCMDFVLQVFISLSIFISPTITGMHVYFLFLDDLDNIDTLNKKTSEIINIVGKFSKSIIQWYSSDSLLLRIECTKFFVKVLSYLSCFSICGLTMTLLLYGLWDYRFLFSLIYSILILWVFLWYYEDLYERKDRDLK